MGKSFRGWHGDQVWLLPPSINDLVLADHVAHFVRDTVRTALDLGLIYRSYHSERRRQPFHLAMMVALLLYAYSQGLYASRRIAKAVFEANLPFPMVTDPGAPPIRPERHIPNSITILRRRPHRRTRQEPRTTAVLQCTPQTASCQRHL